ncbi:MAG: cell division protein ZapA [Clostridioides sp.]|jgi:cell division protein ZapA|nr:cell division protein ZapA [Clostridioides sp.]
MNRIVVRINGYEYTIVGENSENHMLQIAEFVDKEIKSIVNMNPKLSQSQAAILSSLNITQLLFECSSENDALMEERDRLKEENKKLIEEKQEYKINSNKKINVLGEINSNKEMDVLSERVVSMDEVCSEDISNDKVVSKELKNVSLEAVDMKCLENTSEDNILKECLKENFKDNFVEDGMKNISENNAIGEESNYTSEEERELYIKYNNVLKELEKTKEELEQAKNDVKISSDLASEFQNKFYELQLKVEEEK